MKIAPSSSSPDFRLNFSINMEDLDVGKIVENGVRVVPLENVEEMYEKLCSHLEEAEIDGVKVDVIHVSSWTHSIYVRVCTLMFKSN